MWKVIEVRERVGKEITAMYSLGSDSAMALRYFMNATADVNIKRVELHYENDS